MVLLQKRTHLLLEPTLAVVRLLPVDVTHQRPKIGRANGKQSIPALPREIADTPLLHPCRRSGFHLGHNPRRASRRGQSQRNVNVVGNAAHAKTLALQLACCPGKISMKVCKDLVMDQRCPMFRTKNDVNQIETQRLCHRRNYMSGFQPSTQMFNVHLGLRPGLLCCRAYGPQISRTTTAGGSQ
jgi:hypothetical protein